MAVHVDQHGGAVGVDGEGAAGAFGGHDFLGQYRVQLGGFEVCGLLFGPA